MFCYTTRMSIKPKNRGKLTKPVATRCKSSDAHWPGHLTILTPGIIFKKPVKLPQWKLDLILDVVHMSGKKPSFVKSYRIAAVFDYDALRKKR